jgi:23S rRNA pseudouridine955/2504/2580 synthase
LPVLLADTPVTTAAGPIFVVREDEDLLAVSKPPGCASHPALRRGGDTLVERVRRYLGEEGTRGEEGEFRVALANRLDIETSGIVLVGKNRPAQRKLGFMLQRGEIGKRYLLLAAGWIDTGAGEITLPLERHPDSRDLARHRAGRPLPEVKIQHAHTRYRVLARAGHLFRATFVEVELVTGRTHQIRRHFAAVGHPVVMDRRYGDRALNEEAASVCGLGRMFLHAHEAVLPHPRTGRRIVLTAPLPEDLRACLRVLGIAWGENTGEGGEQRKTTGNIS